MRLARQEYLRLSGISPDSKQALSAGRMVKLGTDRHEGRVAIRKRTCHPGMAAKLPVESSNDIVGADMSPGLTGKNEIVERLLNNTKRFIFTSAFLRFRLQFLLSFSQSFGIVLFAKNPTKY